MIQLEVVDYKCVKILMVMIIKYVINKDQIVLQMELVNVLKLFNVNHILMHYHVLWV